jgi:hypothetical protein
MIEGSPERDRVSISGLESLSIMGLMTSLIMALFFETYSAGNNAQAIAHMNAESSRAVAAITLLRDLPRAMSLR